MSSIICSTKIKEKYEEENKKFFLTREDLFLDKPLREIYVVSAYTDVKLIEWLITQLNKKGSGKGGVKFKIFLDERQSRFVDESSTKNFLIGLNKKIIEAKTNRGSKLFSRDSGIFLVKRGSLFHSKLIITKSETKVKMLLGSLNFTMKAFDKNEELCLIQDANRKKRVYGSVKQAEDYIELLECCFDATEKALRNFKKGVKPSNLNRNGMTNVYKVDKGLVIPSEWNCDDSLIDYLMRGRLIHPSKSRKFNLYFDLKLDHDAIGKAIENDNEFSDLIESSGLKKSLSVMKMLKKMKIEFKEKKLRNKVQQFCIDTPLGFWCPPEKLEDLQKKLNTADDKKQNENLFSILEDNRERLTTRFEQLIDFINKKIENLEYKWVYANKNDALKAWNEWYDKKLGKKNDSIWFNRLNSKYTVSRVPNFADDPVACKEFEDIFKESLEDEISIKGGSAVAKFVYKHHKAFFECF